jgi:hopanoid biosynthesis associated RND transporter like protein HpnN
MNAAMSAERKPQEEHAWLALALGWLTRWVLRFPRTTLAVGVGLAVVSVAFTAWRLEYKASRVDLLSPSSDYNRRWLDFLAEFGDADDVVVVVEGANAEQVRPVVEELAEQISDERRLFASLLYKIDLSNLERKGLHLASSAQLDAIAATLDASGPALQGDWSQFNLSGQIVAASAALANTPPNANQTLSPERLARLQTLLAHVESALTDQPPPKSSFLPSPTGPAAARPSEYLAAEDGRLGLLLLRLVEQGEGMVRGSEGIDTLRATIAKTQAAHPEVRVGLTGLPIMENDEMRVSERDMSLANIISFLGVAAVFVAILGGWRHPLWTSLTLLIGMAWSFGYLTLVIGHLNILSVAFSVFLIGLGMDFGIHYVARYLQLRNDHVPFDDAVVQTAIGIGPGITTGAVTTALAFLTAGVTDFPGVAELGIIAGGGILLCFLASITVLPAMLALSDRNRPRVFVAAPLNVGEWCEKMLRRPGWLLIGCVVATVLMSLGAPLVWYDHNLLNLQSQGLESVDLERKLLADSDQNTWFAISVVDNVPDLLARKKQFLELASVDRVEEIASLVGLDKPDQSTRLAQMSARLQRLPTGVQLIPVAQPLQLAKAVQGMHQAALASPELAPLADKLLVVRDLLFATRPEDYFTRLSRYQQTLAGETFASLQTLRDATQTPPPDFQDLPASLVSRFHSPSGKHVLKVYGKGDIWDRPTLEAFVGELRTVDPEVTGEPLQAFEASREMKESYQTAMLYAFLCSCVVLAVDFRRLGDILLAFLPLGVGMLQMFGLMGWLGVPLNPANMIVLPLIFGIGIDEGVHIIHDYRAQRGAYRMSNSVAVSVLLSSLQEIVGFGSLMISEHQGLQSLGRVLTLGMTTSMFTSLVMLPALLAWLSRRRERTTLAREPVVKVSGRSGRRTRTKSTSESLAKS